MRMIGVTSEKRNILSTTLTIRYHSSTMHLGTRGKSIPLDPPEKSGATGIGAPCAPCVPYARRITRHSPLKSLPTNLIVRDDIRHVVGEGCRRREAGDTAQASGGRQDKVCRVHLAKPSSGNIRSVRLHIPYNLRNGSSWLYFPLQISSRGDCTVREDEIDEALAS